MIVALLLLWMVQSGLAQETQDVAQQAAEPTQTSKSGYENIPQFGGPTSVGAQLEEDDAERVPLLRLPAIDRVLKPWFDWKGRLNTRYGLSFGLDYTALGQWAGASLTDERNAAGGIFRFFGNWTLLGHDSGNTGSLVYKVEHRHTLGTDIAPKSLGFEVGYLGLTGPVFSDTEWSLTNVYWKQLFREGRLQFVVGALDPTDYLDIYGLTNPWTQFSNLVFLTDPTILVPNPGLGAAFGAMATDRLYVLGGLADSNADPTLPGEWFESFFDEREYFYHLELGWLGSFDRRYFDNLHLTGWYADERKNALVEDGWGLAFSATTFVNDTWMPFLRAGYSDGGGALLEASVSAGIGYSFSESQDLLGFGINWGRPPDSGLNDQYTAELFYRLQVSQNLTLTPDIQWLIDPALNPDEDQIWIFGLRGRLAM
ncbi:MAG: carbohydrate porin [bacterium]|nr:carbohydrate porin [bacterium]